MEFTADLARKVSAASSHYASVYTIEDGIKAAAHSGLRMREFLFSESVTDSLISGLEAAGYKCRIVRMCGLEVSW